MSEELDIPNECILLPPEVQVSEELDIRNAQEANLILQLVGTLLGRHWSCLGFKVQGLGFRVSGLGFRARSLRV